MYKQDGARKSLATQWNIKHIHILWFYKAQSSYILVAEQAESLHETILLLWALAGAAAFGGLSFGYTYGISGV